jgi:hypothetical protein
MQETKSCCDRYADGCQLSTPTRHGTVPKPRVANARGFAAILVEKIPLAVEARHRDKNGEIGHRHGNTLIRTLRKSYGAQFAEGCRDDETLSDVLHKMDEPSSNKLIEDHGRGKLADICRQR